MLPSLRGGLMNLNSAGAKSEVSWKQANKTPDCECQKQNHGRDPPDWIDAGTGVSGSEFTFHKSFVIEIFIGQIQTVCLIGIRSPPSTVIRTAFRARQGTRRHIFTANRADFRCLGS